MAAIVAIAATTTMAMITGKGLSSSAAAAAKMGARLRIATAASVRRSARRGLRISQ
jgi:hypothetical protein